MSIFKKNKKNDEVAIRQILNDYYVDNTPLSNFVQQLTKDGKILSLSLRMPDTVDVERVHRELGHLMQACGIDEIHMNVKLYQKMPSNHDKQAQMEHDAPLDAMPKPASKQSQIPPHPRIRHIIVVASGKGGVGKSTTAVNIALALQKLGQRVGMLDADIYGPSIPDMLGVAGIKPAVDHGRFVPIEAFAMPIMSIGSLLDSTTTPIAWRGIKATGALMQLFQETDYPPLDYLIVDMPPGTGDIQLSLAQRIPVTGAVIVTTPQHIALLDAQKGIEMFIKTDIPVLGVVENMALHTCSHCGHVDEIFGEGGGKKMADDYDIPLLGRLPIARQIRENADRGMPSVVADDEFAQYYLHIARNIERHIAKFAKVRDDKRIF